MTTKALIKAIPYAHKILQFCPANGYFSLIHVLNISDLAGTSVSQGLSMLKEIHQILVVKNNYATCFQQAFPRPTWYALTDEGRQVKQSILKNPPPTGHTARFAEVLAADPVRNWITRN